jgi:hypothetical protein
LWLSGGDGVVSVTVVVVGGGGGPWSARDGGGVGAGWGVWVSVGVAAGSAAGAGAGEGGGAGAGVAGPSVDEHTWAVRDGRACGGPLRLRLRCGPARRRGRRGGRPDGQ